jgi:hypothetical protein
MTVDDEKASDPADSGDMEIEVAGDPEPERRPSLRERANAPSDTVGTGSYAAITCSVLALFATALLIGGLLISRWLF